MTRTTPISVAVIGAGMAGRTHANAWRQAGTVFDLGLPPVRLAAIADMHLPFAEDAAQRYGYERAVSDWRELADDPSIDVVSIVVGNALHREIAEALVASGKHVLCEKPLAGTLEDAAAMAALERSAPEGVVTATGFTYRRNPAVAMLSKLVADGNLGTVSHLEGRYWCDYGADARVPMAWRFRGAPGSGALGDVGSHLVDTAELIGGSIESVSGGVLVTTIPERPVAAGAAAGGRGVTSTSEETEPVENDDVATFTAQFASGAAGTFSCSRVAHGMPNAMMIDVMGTEGTAKWDMTRGGEILLSDGSAPAELPGFRQVLASPTFPYFGQGSSMDFAGVGLNQIEQFTYQAHAFLQQVASITEGALPACATFAEGYREMRILDAVAQSAQAGGTRVEIA